MSEGMETTLFIGWLAFVFIVFPAITTWIYPGKMQGKHDERNFY